MASVYVSFLVHSSALVTLEIYLIKINRIFFSIHRFVYFVIKITYISDWNKLIAISTINNIRIIRFLLYINIIND